MFCAGPGLGQNDPCWSLPIQDILWFYMTISSNFKRVSKSTEMSILDTFHSVHTGDQAVVPHGRSMHVDGQDPRLMASESKANHGVSSVVFRHGNALS